ncbi:TlpA family protein disulfide reductase [Sphingomicrobium clamense]|uniref:TlpA family protein disulfide reductase n=1 Tax=Sphingomicrobium clamense TaxID=2851013 RepID=A0ABS6V3F6_9SPHN|nr:TlpA disulfide reductase family protein [Sphingomicrobium sp. B8]MBW0144087.1 TlpA family protein disulfide reductase [Sphingomicrobium sp. B8]
MKKLIMIAALLSLAACDAGSEEPSAVSPTGAGVQREFAGSELPTLEILSPEGETVSLAEVHGGEPMLVNLWASWCAPCIEELPTLVELSQREGAPSVLTLNQDMGPQPSVRAFLKDKGLTGVETWQDAEMGMTDALAIQIMPTTVLYDAQGREVWRFVGDLDWSGEEAAALLAELD